MLCISAWKRCYYIDLWINIIMCQKRERLPSSRKGKGLILRQYIITNVWHKYYIYIAFSLLLICSWRIKMLKHQKRWLRPAKCVNHPFAGQNTHHLPNVFAFKWCENWTKIVPNPNILSSFQMAITQPQT